MRILKKTAFILLILAVIISAGAWTLFPYLKPTYTGEIQSSNLQNNVNTYFDEFEILHIYAENKVSAYTELGYSHAQIAKKITHTTLKTDVFPSKLENKLIDWNWGKVLTLQHPYLFKIISKIKKHLITRLFLKENTSEVIDNRIFDYNETKYYLATEGLSTRRIIDFSDIENSIYCQQVNVEFRLQYSAKTKQNSIITANFRI